MPEPLSIAIVGAGFSGLAMALACKRAGLDQDLTVFEAAPDIGGTWRDNTYPGCACDVPSHLYALRDAPRTDWSRRFGEQPEILAYIRDLADRHGLRPHLRTSTPITSAELDPDTLVWTLTTGTGEKVQARALVLAPGPLAKPAIPDLPGRDDFEGVAVHTQRWPDDLDLRGKRVAVVGTGASAVQVVPAIVEQVGHLDLYQRTPAWILPRHDRAFSDLELRLFRHVPGARWAYRNLLFLMREALFAPAFTRPGLVSHLLTGLLRRHLRRAVADPDLRARLTPEYVPGCKRIIVSDDYYPAVQHPAVTLVDRAVAAVTPTGLVDADGVERPADVIVWATGFRPTDFLSHVSITHGARSLEQAWAEHGIQAHRGTCVAGFPNLFLLLGPNTGLGHNSVLLMAEAQADYAVRCLLRLRDEGLRGLDVHPDAQRAWNRDLQTRLSRTVWLSGCSSWYLAEDGVNRTLWPDSVWAFQRAMRRPDPREFRALR